MAIQDIDNRDYRGKKPNFVRDSFDTVSQMKSWPETDIDDGHISVCQEDGHHYEFKSTNQSDPTTGKWRRFPQVEDSLSSDSSDSSLSAKMGKSLQTRISEVESAQQQKDEELKGLIDAKVIEAGGVSFDTAPTQSSANPVTSGGLFNNNQNRDSNTGISEYGQFSSGTSYSAGTIVFYQNLLYKFTQEHPAGDWTPGHVERTSIKKEMETKLAELSSIVYSDSSDINKYLIELYISSDIISENDRLNIVRASSKENFYVNIFEGETTNLLVNMTVPLNTNIVDLFSKGGGVYVGTLIFNSKRFFDDTVSVEGAAGYFGHINKNAFMIEANPVIYHSQNIEERNKKYKLSENDILNYIVQELYIPIEADSLWISPGSANYWLVASNGDTNVAQFYVGINSVYNDDVFNSGSKCVFRSDSASILDLIVNIKIPFNSDYTNSLYKTPTIKGQIDSEEIKSKTYSTYNQNIYTDNGDINKYINELYIENYDTSTEYELDLTRSSDKARVYINLYKDKSSLVAQGIAEFSRIGDSNIFTISPQSGYNEKGYIIFNVEKFKSDNLEKEGAVRYLGVIKDIAKRVQFSLTINSYINVGLYTDNSGINKYVSELYLTGLTDDINNYKLNLTRSSSKTLVYINVYNGSSLIINTSVDIASYSYHVISLNPTEGNAVNGYIIVDIAKFANDYKDVDGAQGISGYINENVLNIYKSKTIFEYVSKISALPILSIPQVWYGLEYNVKTQNYITRMYPEGLFPAKTPLLINNGKSKIMEYYPITQTSNKASYTIPITITDLNGNVVVTKNCSLKRTKIENAKSKKIIHQGIGDSLSDGGYSAIVEYIAKCHNKDFGNISVLAVGTLKDTLNKEYKGETFNIESYNEGRSGWAAHDFLRKAIMTRAKVSDYYPNTRIMGKAAWDSLGLGTMTRNGVKGRDYVGYDAWTEEKGNLIRETCHGWYDADPTAELWDWIVNKRGVKSFTYNEQEYTFGSSYSSVDDDAQKAYIKYLCENPETPFYDYMTVQTSEGKYAFNYATYLSRYKTVEDDGITPLEVETSAGTLVKNVSDYRVCKPTHVTVILSTNDINQVTDLHSEDVAKDSLLIAQLIKEYDSKINVSVGFNRQTGVFYPERWEDIGYIKEISVQTLSYLADKYCIDNPTDGIDYIPLYAAQSVLMDSGNKTLDLIDLQEKQFFTGDGTHGKQLIDYFDRAYMVLSWIYSTI